MSSLSSVAARPSTSSLSSFFERFRYTNNLYKNRAAEFRSSLRLTSHARQRAAYLELHVDTQKAVRCDQRQVSNVPLPIIDTEPSPLQLECVYEDVQSVLFAPQSVSCLEDGDEEMEMETDADMLVHAEVAAQIERPLHRPELRCAIPTPAEMEETSPSKFSPDSEYSAITLASMSSSTGKGHCHPEVRPEPLLQYPPASSVAVVFYTEEENGSVREQVAGHFVHIPAPSARHLLQPIGVPVDATRMSWGCGEMNEMDATSASSTSTEYAGSDTSISGLTTPGDVETTGHQGPFVIRIKRSHSFVNTKTADDAEHCDSTEDSAQLEKRPKFERKGWARQYAKRSLNLLRVPPMRRQS